MSTMQDTAFMVKQCIYMIGADLKMHNYFFTQPNSLIPRLCTPNKQIHMEIMSQKCKQTMNQVKINIQCLRRPK